MTVLSGHTVRRYSSTKEQNIPFPCIMIKDNLSVFCHAYFQIGFDLVAKSGFDLVAKSFSHCWLCSLSFSLIHLGPSGPCLGKGPSGSVQYIPLSSRGKELHLQNKETSKRALARSQFAVLRDALDLDTDITCLLHVTSQMLLCMFLLLPVAMSPPNRCIVQTFSPSFNMQTTHMHLLSTYRVPTALGNKTNER